MKMSFVKGPDVELNDVPRPYLRWLRRPDGPRATADRQGTGIPQEFGACSVRHSGNVGQEILGPDGKVVAWATDAWVARVICQLLNENEG